MNLSTLCIEKQDPYLLVSLESVARQVGADSATMSMVSKLKSIFAAKGFEVGGINIPGQIPVIDTADPEVEQRGVKNMFQKAISFGKNIAKSVVPIAVAAAGGFCPLALLKRIMKNHFQQHQLWFPSMILPCKVLRSLLKVPLILIIFLVIQSHLDMVHVGKTSWWY